jgi:hypothetical protein
VNPEVCVATAGDLPATGGTMAAPVLLLLAGVLIAAGAAALLVHRHRTTALLVAGVLVAGAVAFSPATAPAARALPGGVSYSDGCTLIDVTDVVLPALPAGGVVPGDDVALVVATVRNPTDAAVSLRLSATLAPGIPALSTRTLVDGSPRDTATLEPGERIEVVLRATLPVTAGNAAQGAGAASTLVITATQP